MKNTVATKQKIMHITRHLIDNGGIDAVNMREIGRKINLSRGAVYRHFANKEDLLAAIVVEDFQELTKNIFSLSEETGEPDILVQAILHAYYEFGTKNREHYQLMFGREWDKNQYPAIYSVAAETFGIVAKCLEKAQEQEYFINKPVNELTAMAYAFIHGLVELYLAGHSEAEKGLNEPHALIDSFLSLLKA